MNFLCAVKLILQRIKAGEPGQQLSARICMAHKATTFVTRQPFELNYRDQVVTFIIYSSNKLYATGEG